MDIETEVTLLMNSLVPGERFYFGTTPDDFDAHDEVFVIGQFVGGDEGMYVDGTLRSGANNRLQLWIWGARYMEVSALTRKIRKAFVELNATWQGIFRAAWLNGSPTDDYNETIKIHGKRMDISVVYADQDAPLP